MEILEEKKPSTRGRKVGSVNKVNRNVRHDLEKIFSKGINSLEWFLNKSIREEDFKTYIDIMTFIGKKVIADKRDIGTDGTTDNVLKITVTRQD